VDIAGTDGATRTIYRTIGNNGSFGGNSLVENFGLLGDRSVARLTVTWPKSQTTQTFRDIAADQTVEITEGTDAPKVLVLPKSPQVRTVGN
jgi:hypothetical protein